VYIFSLGLRRVIAPIRRVSQPTSPRADHASPLTRSDRAETSSYGLRASLTRPAEVGKVTVTSSVVGVIVLVISLAFLYIYTREVYHIQIVDPFRPTLKDPVQAEPAKGAAK
jgi:hypothetical protein